jgi:pimeloyl-ACP methyl ester carboxylesterase
VLKLIIFIIIAPLLLVLVFMLFSFVVSYQRSNSNQGSRGNATTPCTVSATMEAPTSSKSEAPSTFSVKITSTTCIDALTYEWNFGDQNGNFFIQGKNSQSHTYNTPGTYHWEVRVNASGTTRYGSGGQIEIKPETEPRLIVALFSGFLNLPNSENGMTTLLDEIKNDSGVRWNTDVFAAVFTYDNQRRNGESDPACQPQFGAAGPGGLGAPHKCALQWLSRLQPQVQDKIVLIGHSYGGNRARLMSYDIASWNPNLKIAGLVTIDAIDWDRCMPKNAEGLNDLDATCQNECQNACNQSCLELDCSPIVINRISYTQTQGVFFTPGGLSIFSPCLQGYRLSNANKFRRLADRHNAIDDNQSVHQEIRQFLASLPASKITKSMPVTVASATPTPNQRRLAYPGKFTDIGVVQSCQGGLTSMQIKPSAACDFYVMAGGAIWRPNREGFIDTKVSFSESGKPLRVWVSPKTAEPISFIVDFIKPDNCR